MFDSSRLCIYLTEEVYIYCIVNGNKVINYQHFKLKQSATTHHEFELSLPYDALPERQNQKLEQANEFLGKRLSVIFQYKDFDTKDSPETVFVGVITNVGFSQEGHSLGNIVLKGFSPTILLDSAPHTQSFGGDNLVNTGIIADYVIKQGLDSLYYDFKVNAKANSYIPFSIQYNETHYNYLCRLAEAYGEQFYYDGECLHFGEIPPPNKPVDLVSGSSITNLKVEIKAVHTKPSYYGYNSSSNAKLTSGHTRIKHKSDLANTSYNRNEKIFTTESLQIAPIRATTDMDVVLSQTSASGSKATEVFSVTADTSVPFLYPGCVADIYIRKENSDELSYFTRVMMVEVNHELDARGEYKGSFKAIASDTGYMPKPEFEIPKAEPQFATVISNIDPQGQGRVKVRFDWQNHDTTDFIRVMSPDAGGTGAITQNRGYVAIPEVGDQVMVGFVHNHPDRPFVMGGLFHGGTALGGGIDNHLRSIQTKSGIKILMNDNDRSVRIEDPSGNTYFMDGKGNINITAPNKITMNATDIHMNAYNNLEMNVSNNVIINAMSKLFIFTPFMKNVVSGFMSFFSGKALFSSKETLDIEAKETKLHGKEKTIVHSDKQAIINSKGTAEMYGESGNQLSNKAVDMTTTQTYTISTAIVYFRPATAWNGEYGFDWLREKDNGLAPADDPAYDTIIEGGYNDGVTDLTGGATGTAYTKLKTEYKNIPISRKSLPAGSAAPATPPSTDYFVPYINLFSKEFVDTLPATVSNKPRFEAEIRVLVEIEEDIDRLEFEYDTTLFTIDKPILSDKTKTNGLVNGSDTLIKITCLKDLDSEKEIAIYAYPKKEPLKGKEVENPALQMLPDLKQLINRKLAGKIIVLKNDATERKNQKFVLARVRTKIDDVRGIKTGNFSPSEQKRLQEGLYQCLVTNELEAGPILDLSNDSKFQLKTDAHGNKIYGEYIFENTTNDIRKTDGNINEDKAGIFNYIKNLYISQYPQYSGYYTMFSFDENTYDSFYDPSTRSAGAVPGQVENINIKNVFLFNGIQGATRGNDTISHEGLHGLGLFHTHKDGSQPIKNANIKYIFANGNQNPTNSTDNIMSYGQKNKKSTWKWQWDIVKNNV